jgi:RHS repeat-associated protein
VGNVLRTENTGFVTFKDPDLERDVAQVYTYDDLHRLVHARGEYDRNEDSVDIYENNFAYDTIGNILNKDQDHWISHPSDGSISPRPHTTYDYDYEYAGPRPHAATHIGGKTYHYDLNGNTAKWVEDQTKREMVFTWDEENRLRATEEQGRLTIYRYDDAGTRVLKRGKYGEVVYVNENYSIREGEVASKHVFAGSTRIVTKLAMKENKQGSKQGYKHEDGHSGRVPEKSRGNRFGWGKKIEVQGMALGHEKVSKGQLKKAERAPDKKGRGASAGDVKGKKGKANEKAKGAKSYEGDDTALPGKSEKGLENALSRGKGHKYGIYKRLERLGYEVTEEGDIVPEGEGDGSGAPGDGGAPLVGKRYGRIPTELGIYYYHGDHLGSSNVITDRKGRTYEHVEYFPYGETWVDEQRSQTNLPYRFTGKELDPETGMYYFGARYYEPRISRWMSADPMIEKYLPTGNKERDKNIPADGVYNPININIYHFSALNPTNYIDPDGNLNSPANPYYHPTITSAVSAARLHPVEKVIKPHHGTDRKMPVGTPLVAMGSGKVLAAYKSDTLAGNTVIVSHGKLTEGKFKGKFLVTIYMHNKENVAKTGDVVKEGELIARSGTAGTGPHSHYEFRVFDEEPKTRTDIFKEMPSVKATPEEMKDFGKLKWTKGGLWSKKIPYVRVGYPKTDIIRKSEPAVTTMGCHPSE